MIQASLSLRAGTMLGQCLAQRVRPIKRSELQSHMAGPPTMGQAAGVGPQGSSGLSPQGPACSEPHAVLPARSFKPCTFPESFGGGHDCHLHFGDEKLGQREALGLAPNMAFLRYWQRQDLNPGTRAGLCYFSLNRKPLEF